MKNRRKTAAIITVLGAIILVLGIVFFCLVSAKLNSLSGNGIPATEDGLREILDDLDAARAEGWPVGVSAFESAMIRMGIWARYVCTGLGVVLTLTGLGILLLEKKRTESVAKRETPSRPDPEPKPEPTGRSCPHCGRRIDGESRFCTYCGGDTEAEVQDRYCPLCNTEIEPGCRFCVVCGTPLAGDARLIPVPKPEPTPVPKPEPTPVPKPERRSKGAYMKKSGDF